jgi:uncharacterized circularly permuted ATP-grasp superfamily protein/uncharacterized alpha-E superfamily protein
MSATSALKHYAVPTGARDDAFVNGAWSTSWTGLGAELDQLGAPGMQRAADALVRHLRDNGVTYNHYGDGDEHERPWQLDPGPYVIEAAEWATLSAGLIQRARTLDAVIADCYGTNRLLHEGVLSPAAVFGHPGFLRPLHGVTPPGGRHLHLYAADMVRDAQGRWMVLADRTQVPAGAGYALENRVVLTRVLPGPFQRLSVDRLAGYFLTLRQTLRDLAPTNRDNPRIVLLTPGPRSTTYFEHAYLARYLGVALVEGADLTVRDDRVHLKTLTGLVQVDVILRRLDDDACDPLELRSSSLLGVPGLVRAVRAGTVAVVNPLGSSIGENGALMPVMDTLCRRFLDESLTLPSIESWCGAAAITARMDAGEDLVVRPITNAAPTFTRELDAAGKAALRAQVEAYGQVWMAQRHMPLATAPVWESGTLHPRTVALRAFCVAEGDGWRVMPGGLCRVSERQGHAVVSMQRGGGSKDCWVLADSPVEQISLLPSPTKPMELRRGGIDIPSRVADNLYWLGRYAERIEGGARLLRAAWQRIGSREDAATVRQTTLLIHVISQLGISPPDDKDEYSILQRLITDRRCNGSLAALLPRLQDSAFAVRDRISNDLWRAVVGLRDDLAELPEDPGSALAILDQVVVTMAAVAGMGSENTTRGPAWRFLDIGRRLERAMVTLDLLKATIGGKARDEDLEVILDVADSALTYRSRYLGVMQAHTVLDLLLTDATNPRSVAFQLAVAADHVANLPRDAISALPSQPERLAIGVHTWMRLLDPTAICRRDGTNTRPELLHVLDHLASDIGVLSEALASHYFNHAAASRSLAGG